MNKLYAALVVRHISEQFPGDCRTIGVLPNDHSDEGRKLLNQIIADDMRNETGGTLIRTMFVMQNDDEYYIIEYENVDGQKSDDHYEARTVPMFGFER